MKRTGIYYVIGPHGVYIGQSRDCYERNELAIKLGLSWGIAKILDKPTSSELILAEREVADKWASEGWAVVSRNTSGHFELLRREWSKRKLSEKHKAVLRAANIGRKNTAETKEKMRQSYRTVLSAESRAKISSALKGRKQPRELVEKRAASNRGKKQTPETRTKISAALKGRTFSPEWRQKLSVSARSRYEHWT